LNDNSIQFIGNKNCISINSINEVSLTYPNDIKSLSITSVKSMLDNNITNPLLEIPRPFEYRDNDRRMSISIEFKKKST